MRLYVDSRVVAEVAAETLEDFRPNANANLNYEPSTHYCPANACF